MRVTVGLAATMGWVALVGAVAGAQEYSIRNPEQPNSSPVYLTEPVSGAVEVTNLPAEQGVQVLGGRLDEPLEVTGEVRLQQVAPLAVEVVNPVLPADTVQLEGELRVDDSVPLRVWLENPPAPAPEPPPVVRRRYGAFSFMGTFEAEQSVLRQAFAPAAEEVFRLTDLVLDTRPDAVLRVRVLASAAALDGWSSAAHSQDLPLLVLDSRVGPAARPATPIPLRGTFSVEVETLGPGLGAPFRVLAAGILEGGAMTEPE